MESTVEFVATRDRRSCAGGEPVAVLRPFLQEPVDVAEFVRWLWRSGIGPEVQRVFGVVRVRVEPKRSEGCIIGCCPLDRRTATQKNAKATLGWTLDQLHLLEEGVEVRPCWERVAQEVPQRVPSDWRFGERAVPNESTTRGVGFTLFGLAFQARLDRLHPARGKQFVGEALELRLRSCVVEAAVFGLGTVGLSHEDDPANALQFNARCVSGQNELRTHGTFMSHGSRPRNQAADRCRRGGPALESGMN